MKRSPCKRIIISLEGCIYNDTHEIEGLDMTVKASTTHEAYRLKAQARNTGCVLRVLFYPLTGRPEKLPAY